MPQGRKALSSRLPLPSPIKVPPFTQIFSGTRYNISIPCGDIDVTSAASWKLSDRANPICAKAMKEENKENRGRGGRLRFMSCDVTPTEPKNQAQVALNDILPAHSFSVEPSSRCGDKVSCGLSKPLSAFLHSVDGTSTGVWCSVKTKKQIRIIHEARNMLSAIKTNGFCDVRK